MSKQASSDKAPIATVKDCATSDLLASRGKEEATSGGFFFFGSLPVEIYCEIEAKNKTKGGIFKCTVCTITTNVG